MLSIALFPCLFTGTAGIVGELSNVLDLKVSTDIMILAEMKKNCAIPVKDLESSLFGNDKKAYRWPGFFSRESLMTNPSTISFFITKGELNRDYRQDYFSLQNPDV